jgi:hypothetical protein
LQDLTVRDEELRLDGSEDVGRFLVERLLHHIRCYDERLAAVVPCCSTTSFRTSASLKLASVFPRLPS